MTPSTGGDTRIKLTFLRLNLERTLDKPRGKMGMDGSGEETIAKKVISLQRAMTKKGRQFFFKKK